VTERKRPIIYSDPVPDRLGLVVRAVCGLLLGLVLGFLVWVRGRFGMMPGLIVR
jgi:hypothetical protein